MISFEQFQQALEVLHELDQSIREKGRLGGYSFLKDKFSESLLIQRRKIIEDSLLQDARKEYGEKWQKEFLALENSPEARKFYIMGPLK